MFKLPAVIGQHIYHLEHPAYERARNFLITMFGVNASAKHIVDRVFIVSADLFGYPSAVSEKKNKVIAITDVISPIFHLTKVQNRTRRNGRCHGIARLINADISIDRIGERDVSLNIFGRYDGIFAMNPTDTINVDERSACGRSVARCSSLRLFFKFVFRNHLFAKISNEDSTMFGCKPLFDGFFA